jgi:hypothetical protein
MAGRFHPWGWALKSAKSCELAPGKAEIAEEAQFTMGK